MQQLGMKGDEMLEPRMIGQALLRAQRKLETARGQHALPPQVEAWWQEIR